MTPETKQSIERFVRRVLWDNVSTNPLGRLEIHHCPKHAAQSLIWHHSWGEDSYPESAEEAVKKVGAIVGFICQTITDDASQMRGMQRYRLVALDQEREKLGRLLVRVDGIDDGIDDDVDDVDPTLRGLMKQLMRDNTALVKSSQMGFAQIIHTQQRMLDRSMTHVEELLDRQAAMRAEIEEAQSLNHERQIEMMQEKSSLQMKESAFKSIKMLAPAVVNRVSGTKALPTGTSPKAMLIDELLRSIDAEQAKSLAASGILKPDQLIAIMELINDTPDDDEDANSHNSDDN